MVRKSIIVALGRAREIGKKNKLLWHIPEDLKYFKRVTQGAPVIMGKTTYLSLPDAFRPLPGRTNIVLMRSNESFDDAHHDSVRVVHSIEDAFLSAQEVIEQSGNEEVFVIGGASIYAQTIDFVDRLYVTIVDAYDADADTFFPSYTEMFQKEVSSESHDNGEYRYRFVILEK